MPWGWSARRSAGAGSGPGWARGRVGGRRPRLRRSRRRGRWSWRSKKRRGRAGCVCRRRWVVGVVITEGEPRSGGDEPPCFHTGRAASVKRCAPHSLSVRGVFAARNTREKTPSKNRMHVGNVCTCLNRRTKPLPQEYEMQETKRAARCKTYWGGGCTKEKGRTKRDGRKR